MKNTIFTRSFKEAVLQALVQDQKFLRESIGILKPEYMDEEIYQGVIDSISKGYIRDKQAPSRPALLNDLVNFLSRINKAEDREQVERLCLRPATELLNKLYNPISEDLSDIKFKFTEYCKTREMQLTIASAFEKLDTGEIDGNTVFSEVRKTFLRSNRQEDIGLNVFEDVASLADDLKDMRSRLFTSGFSRLDRVMGGGITPETLTTWIGSAKGGKSMTLVNTAYKNAMAGNGVVVFTLEINAKKWRNRLYSRISNIPINDLDKKTSLVVERVEKFKKRWSPKLWIKEYPSGTASVESLRSYLYYLQGQHNAKFDVVVVDYADLLRSTNSKIQDERFVQKDCYTDLRALASEFKCAIVTASQCNRDGTNKPIIRMKDIAESFAKVQISDHILTLCQTDNEAVEKRLRLFFAGSREAEAGAMIHIRHDWPTCNMIELKDDEISNSEKKADPDDYF